MKTYAYSIAAILVALLLSTNNTRLFPSDEISLFLTVIGLIYGLIAAFTINAAWERFSKIRDAIAAETNALTVMYIFSKQLSDKQAFNSLKCGVVDYCESVLKTEWHDYWKNDNLHKKFQDLIEVVARIKFKNKRDEELYTHMVGDEIRNAANARTLQLVLSQTRIPPVQWVLNIFLSSIIIIGLVFRYSSSNTILSAFITAGMIAATLMLLVVIYEFDSMKIAEEEVSNEPYRQVIRVVKAS